MVSTTSMIIFGIIVLIAVIIIWKWWNRSTSHKKTDNITDKITDMKLNDILEEEEEPVVILIEQSRENWDDEDGVDENEDDKDGDNKDGDDKDNKDNDKKTGLVKLDEK